MAIIVASTNIAVPYRYLDTAAASHSHGHAWHVCPVYIAILYSHGHHQLESSLRRLNFVLDQIIRRCRAPKWWLSFVAWQLATQDWPHIDFFFPFLFLKKTETLRFSKQRPDYVPEIPLFGNVPLPVDRALKSIIANSRVLRHGRTRVQLYQDMYARPSTDRGSFQLNL